MGLVKITLKRGGQLKIREFVLKIIKQLGKPPLILLLMGLFLRLIVAPFTGHPYDLACFAQRGEWFYVLQYNPLYWWNSGTPSLGLLLGFYPIHLILSFFGFGSILTLQLVIKLPFILADIGVAILLYKMAYKKTQNRRISNLLTASWIFNPFVILSSSIHGVTDSISVFFVLLAVLFLLKGKHIQSFASLTISASIKYFAFFLFPLFILYSWRKTTKHDKTASVIVSSSIVGISFLPMLVDPVLRRSFLDRIVFHTMTAGEIHVSRFSIWRSFQVTGVLNYIPKFVQGGLFWITFTPIYILIVTLIYKNYREKRLEDLDVFKYCTTLLLSLVLLHPSSTPHHLLWALPFMLYLSFTIRGLNMVANILCVLNMAIRFTYFSPFGFMWNINVHSQDIYPWPYMPHLSEGFNLVYSLLMLTVIITVSRFKSSTVSLRLNTITLQHIISRRRSLIFSTIFMITVFLGAAFELTNVQLLPNYCRMRGTLNRWSILPSEVNTYTTTKKGFAEFRYEIDRVHFMNDRTYNATYAYIEFNGLPPSSSVKVNGISVPSSTYGDLVEIEIPNTKETLKEHTVVHLEIPNFPEFPRYHEGFELGLDNWTVSPSTQVSIDAATEKSGNKILKTSRIETRGWVWVYRDVPTTENVTCRVEVWMKTENVWQAHFKIEYFDKANRLLEVTIPKGIDGTHDWWRVNTIITTPPNATCLRVFCMGGASLDGINPGVTLFDNITISPTSLEDIEATLVIGFDLDEVTPWWRENLPIVFSIVASDLSVGLFLVIKLKKWSTINQKE